MRVLFIAEVQWRSQVSRKHQLIRRFPDSWSVYYTSPMNAAPGENTFHARSERSGPDVRYVSLPLPKPDAKLAPLRAASPLLEAMGGIRLRAIATSFSPDIVVCSYIWAHPAARRFRAEGVPVVYDLNDLHYEFYPRDPDGARAAFRSLVGEVDEVVASSERLRSVAGRGVLIGNGVDLVTFAGRRDGPEPEEIAGSPLAGKDDLVAYVGSVDDRIDFEALERTAAELEKADRSGLLCVGRIFDSVSDRVRRLSDRYPERVLFTGRVAYERLPDFLSRAAVGVAPFLLNEKTAAINPNKLYMYAAMDVNVVSTPFSDEVRQYSDLVFLAREPEAFAAAVNDALGDDERRRAVRENIALANSWDEKARAYVELLTKLVRGKPA
jgi:glycosyltransferase involved in cell wall biosynthesis